MPCMQCLTTDGVPNFLFSKVEVQETGLYRSTCSRGHPTAMVLQQLRFELLSEIAANAIADGYYREAITSFAAALERFYEFYIAVICRKRGLAGDAFAATWKGVVNQSERQFGAFQFLYLAETGSAPPVLPPNLVTLRNSDRGTPGGQARTARALGYRTFCRTCRRTSRP